MIDERWDDEVEAVADALQKMLGAESSSSAVRAAETAHHAASPAMAAQIEAFGLDQIEGSAALFARVALELGRALAPTAFVDTLPVLALTGRPGISHGFNGYAPASVPMVAVCRDEALYCQPLRGMPRETQAGDLVVLQGHADDAEKLGGADLADRVQRYGALTNAARLVGAATAMLDYAKTYVSEREQFGRPIGSFQAVAHRLVDAVAGNDAAELLVRKAAFAADLLNGGDGAPPQHFATMVWVKAVQAARTTATSVHQVFGGNGFAMEYDVQLYSRRIRSWAMRGPRSSSDLIALGRAVLDPARRDAMKLLWQFDEGIHIPRWAAEADAPARKET